MKGDFSRFSDDYSKRFTRVLKQQGRVDVDADFNELVEIRTQLERTEARDVIGPCGVPTADPGFGITFEVVDVGVYDLNISAGRLYLQGLLVESDIPESYLAQPFYPHDEVPEILHPESEPRTDLVFIDVWERHITAIEDPSIREVALGGPDTTTRTQTIWQVKVLVGSEGQPFYACDEALDWPEPASDYKLSTSTVLSTTPGPCDAETDPGYRSLENHLYRVEMHSIDEDEPTKSTFKWSRENGSVVFAVEAFDSDLTKLTLESLGRDQVIALHIDDWVEVSDDDSELAGEAGDLFQIQSIDHVTRVITLKDPLTNTYSVDKHPKVRRWESGPIEIGAWDTEIALECGIQISFAATPTFGRVGDYWAFTARAAIREVEILDKALPRGIKHHYCALALLQWTPIEEGWSVAVTDCRAEFHPLISKFDIRDHNRYLHGWGIVCGLQVMCSGSDEKVTVRPGYAIDCMGNDMRLGTAQDVEILPPGGDDDYDICLYLELDAQQSPVVKQEEYKPIPDTPSSVLEGTLLKDFYDTYIQDGLLEKLSKILDSNPSPVISERDRLFIALKSLLIEAFDNDNGQYVFLSKADHDILLDFYKKLKEVIEHFAYCGMFQDAPVFPKYPEEWKDYDISTVYGKSEQYRRLRTDAAGVVGIAVGYENCSDPDKHFYELHAFELTGTDKKLVNAIALSDECFNGKIPQDVALLDMTDKVALLCVIATGEEGLDPDAKRKQTTVATATIDRDTLEVTSIWTSETYAYDDRDIELVTLVPERVNMEGIVSSRLFAVSRGTGLYQINDATSLPTPAEFELWVQFTAVGHLVLGVDDVSDDKRLWAYASRNSGVGAINVYDSVKAVDVTDPLIEAPEEKTFLCQEEGGIPKRGQDDIMVTEVIGGDTGRHAVLFAVVDDPVLGGPSVKNLMHFDASKTGHDIKADKMIPIDSSLKEHEQIRLGYCLDQDDATKYLLVTCSDSFKVLRASIVDGGVEAEFSIGMDAGYRFPVQIGTESIVCTNQNVYVLNQRSPSITATSAAYFTNSCPTPGDPGTQEFLNTLSEYRSGKDAAHGVDDAYFTLGRGVVQYLKDGLCDLFLVNCPECDEDDKVYLASVSVRGKKVFKVCNFAMRRYVKSFPTVGYWFSLLPVGAIIKWAGSKICCMVLDDFYTKGTDLYDYRDMATQGFAQLAKMVFNQPDIGKTDSDIREIYDQAKAMFDDYQGEGTVAINEEMPEGAVIDRDQLIGITEQEAIFKLTNTGLVWAGTEPYERDQVFDNIFNLIDTQTIKEGREILLYVDPSAVEGTIVRNIGYKEEEDGEATPSGGDSTALPAPRSASNSLKRDLQGVMTELQNRLKSMEDEIAELRSLEETKKRAPRKRAAAKPTKKK